MHAGNYFFTIHLSCTVLIATGADKMYFVILLACSLSLVAAEIGRYITSYIELYVTVSAKTVPIGTTIEIHFMA